MYKEHPWNGFDFGPIEYYWYLERHYVFNVEFDVQMKPFIDFCKQKGQKSQTLMMKLTTRLSAEHLPQRTFSLNWKCYPARYPAGYVRPVRDGFDMLEHVAVREKPNGFAERNIREGLQPWARRFAIHTPRLAAFLAKRVFYRQDVKNNYALMVTRNPLRNLGTRVVFHGTHYRTQILCIPFGENTTCTFGAPHALGNINYFEPFLQKFKMSMEDPESIPKDILDKPYREAPKSEN